MKQKVVNAVLDISIKEESKRVVEEQKKKAAEAAAQALRTRLADKIIKLEADRAKQHNDEITAEIAGRLLTSPRTSVIFWR